MPDKTPRKPYFRVDQDYFSNIKVLEISNDAKVLHLKLIAYSAAQKTDGIVPAYLCSTEGEAALKELLAQQMLLKHGKRYQIKDYLEHQTPAQEISRKAGRAAHVRWHVERKKVVDSCQHCREDQLNRGPWKPDGGKDIPF